jgi:predicted restriction endonuclease
MPHKDLEARKAYAAKRYQANKDELKAIVKQHYDNNTAAIRARRLELAPQHRQKNNDRERERYRIIREEIIKEYGSRCACCGETEPLFLEIDHINNDGHKERKLIGTSAKALCIAIKKGGFCKERYQLLCANCNQGKKRNGGICPHKSAPS